MNCILEREEYIGKNVEPILYRLISSPLVSSVSYARMRRMLSYLPASYLFSIFSYNFLSSLPQLILKRLSELSEEDRDKKGIGKEIEMEKREKEEVFTY